MRLSSFVVLLVVSTVSIYQIPLYLYLYRNLDFESGNGIAVTAVVVSVVMLVSTMLYAVLSLLSAKIAKMIFIATSLINSIAIFYMLKFSVTLDKSMIGNILHTNLEEATDHFSPTLIMWVILFGFIPSYLIYRIKIGQKDYLKTVLVGIAASFIAIVVIVTNQSSFLWIDKHSKIIGGKILPFAYIINTIRYLQSSNSSDEVLEPLPDAKLQEGKADVMILVIGETARAANFNLYGYPKPTNPKLTKIPVYFFDRTLSCSTYTTKSLRCILSHELNNMDDEMLPSYIHRHGIYVSWRSNNWGEPSIVVDKRYERAELKEKCKRDGSNGCEHDEFLLSGLEEEIAQHPKALIILHTKGSHGPNYAQRYPKAFEYFEPVCKSEDLTKCSSKSLINAYDNSIVYTDHLLSKIIEMLRRSKRKSALLYLSDHGESLGEDGYYLHGTPYMVAPMYQKEIPMILWLSEKEKQKVTRRPIRITGEFSQGFVFHTVLNLLGLKSPVYDPKLDLIRAIGAR